MNLSPSNINVRSPRDASGVEVVFSSKAQELQRKQADAMLVVANTSSGATGITKAEKGRSVAPVENKNVDSFLIVSHGRAVTPKEGGTSIPMHGIEVIKNPLISQWVEKLEHVYAQNESALSLEKESGVGALRLMQYQQAEALDKQSLFAQMFETSGSPSTGFLFTAKA